MTIIPCTYKFFNNVVLTTPYTAILDIDGPLAYICKLKGHLRLYLKFDDTLHGFVRLEKGDYSYFTNSLPDYSIASNRTWQGIWSVNSTTFLENDHYRT